jgi:hypothetical protein
MCDSIATESGLEFDFHLSYEKADAETCQGLKAVDFIVENDDYLYLIEVKNYEHPNAPEENRVSDYEMLTNKKDPFPLKIGMKVKDTLLRRYAKAKPFSKKIKFLLVIKFSSLQSNERQYLYERIIGYIPKGLNGYPSFSSISFEMPRIDELKSKYGFDIKIL